MGFDRVGRTLDPFFTQPLIVWCPGRLQSCPAQQRIARQARFEKAVYVAADDLAIVTQGAVVVRAKPNRGMLESRPRCDSRVNLVAAHGSVLQYQRAAHVA